MSHSDLLQAGPLMPYLVQELERRFTLWPLHEQHDHAEFLAREGHRFPQPLQAPLSGFTLIRLMPVPICA